MPREPKPQTREALERRIRSFERLANELDLQASSYVVRIRRLEALVAAQQEMISEAGRSAPPRAAGQRALPGGDAHDARQEDRQSGLTAQRLRREVAARDVELRQKEIMIASLVEIADERLHAVELAHAESEQLRQAIEDLGEQLREKDRAIGDLTARADERLRLIDQAAAESALLRQAIQTLTCQLHEKDRAIAALAETCDDRLRLLNQSIAEAERLRGEVSRLTDRLEEKERAISEFAAKAEERVRPIRQAGGMAACSQDSSQATLERLTAELEAKERMIGDLSRIAEERLSLLHRVSLDAARLREALDSATEDSLVKERMISELASAAEDRLEIINRLSSHAANMDAQATASSSGEEGAPSALEAERPAPGHVRTVAPDATPADNLRRA